MYSSDEMTSIPYQLPNVDVQQTLHDLGVPYDSQDEYIVSEDESDEINEYNEYNENKVINSSPGITLRKISTLIFNNITGDGGNYADQSKKVSGKFIYMGQTKGQDDHKIVPYQTLYLERPKNDVPYIYRGLITGKKQLKENDGSGTASGAATYELYLDTHYVHNGIHSGDTLRLVEGVLRGPGSYCLKRSCLKHLGLSCCGNLASGITSVE